MIMHANDYLQNSKEKSVLLLSAGFITVCTEFTNSHYEKIKKVYSIFICMNPPNYRKNTINQYSIQEEFNIKMTQELEREVSEMCNLSEGVEQKGIAKGITASIRNLMESMGWSIEQAMDALQIPTEERNGYLNMLKK